MASRLGDKEVLMAKRRSGKIKALTGSRLAAVAVLAAAVTLLAACGSSSKANSGRTTSSAGGSSSSGLDIAAAKAHIAALLKPVSIDYNPGPLGGSVAGKTVALVTNTTPTGRHTSSLIAEYAKGLGLKTKVYAAGNTAEDIVNSMEQVVNDANSGAIDAVIIDGRPPTQWTAQFNELLAKHFPVIVRSVPDDPSYSSKVTMSVETPEQGTDAVSGDMVDWMIQDANGPVNAVIFSIPSFPVLKTVTDSVQTAFPQKCPATAGCALGVQNLDLAGIGTTMPGSIVSYLQAHPNVKYAMLDFGDMMIGVPAALKAAGITGVKFVTESGSSGTLQDVKDGTLDALYAYPISLILHVMLDGIARSLLGKDLSASQAWKFTPQLMVQSNVNAGTFDSDGTTEAPGITDYFKNIWTN